MSRQPISAFTALTHSPFLPPEENVNLSQHFIKHRRCNGKYWYSLGTALLHADMNGQYHSPASVPKGNEPHVPKAGRWGDSWSKSSGEEIKFLSSWKPIHELSVGFLITLVSTLTVGYSVAYISDLIIIIIIIIIMPHSRLSAH